jgi:uncharacterized protein (DUF3084 family)|tara:strand:+ start:264 stop:611 length:348 start_codon:yes stop_codon:yes gene_type:complete
LNRISVILLCITTLAIFFIINKKEDIDLSEYRDKIEELQQQVEELEQVNDSLELIEQELETKISSYDITINNLNRQLDVIKIETEAKLKAVNDLDATELEWFFTNRYRYSQDTIN